MTAMSRSAGARLMLALATAVSCLAVSGCADRHNIQRLMNPDKTFVLIVDYIVKPFGTQDAVVSLEENKGIATTVAIFRNIHNFDAKWIDPEDIGICQVGTVQDYKTHVVINAHDGNHDFYIQYACPIP